MKTVGNALGYPLSHSIPFPLTGTAAPPGSRESRAPAFPTQLRSEHPDVSERIPFVRNLHSRGFAQTPPHSRASSLFHGNAEPVARRERGRSRFPEDRIPPGRMGRDGMRSYKGNRGEAAPLPALPTGIWVHFCLELGWRLYAFGLRGGVFLEIQGFFPKSQGFFHENEGFSPLNPALFPLNLGIDSFEVRDWIPLNPGLFP